MNNLNLIILWINYQINTFGHMMTFKHFVPLLPGKSKEHDYSNDPAKGLIKPNLSVLASMTARVSLVLLLPLHLRYVLGMSMLTLVGLRIDRLHRRQ